MMKCPICQFDNEDGALFCEQCKSDLAAAQPLAEPVAAGAWVAAPRSESQSAAAVLEAAPPIAEIAVEAATPLDERTLVTAGIAIAEAVPLQAEVPAVSTAEAHSRPANANLADTQSFEMPPSLSGSRIETPALAADTKPKLVVLRGQRINAEYPLYDGENYIGRADDQAVDIDLEEQEAPDRVWSSRQHALIILDGGRLTIEDLNSTNGTFVNRLRVHPGQKRALQVNDVVQVGTVQMRVTV